MPKIKPFSANIIFFDTEFTSLDPYIGEIISIGMIKPNGEELYLELEYDFGKVDDFTKKNVIPKLQGNPISREKAKKQIRDFIGSDKPYLISYNNCFDMVYWYKLFGVKESPAFWIPLDFATLLFYCGLDPEKYYKKQEKFLDLSFNKTLQHNALYDARLLKEAYYKLLKKLNGKWWKKIWNFYKF